MDALSEPARAARAHARLRERAARAARAAASRAADARSSRARSSPTAALHVAAARARRRRSLRCSATRRGISRDGATAIAILRTLCRISIEPDSCVKQTENIFTRWGPPSLLVAKYIPGFSTVAPPLAGTMGVGLGRFLAYSAVAALLWAALPVAGGFFFQRRSRMAARGARSDGRRAPWRSSARSSLAYVAVKAIQRYLLIRFLRMVRISVAELRAMIDDGRAAGDPRRALAARARSRAAAHTRARSRSSSTRSSACSSACRPDRDVVVYCS